MNDHLSRRGLAYLWPAIGALAAVVLTAQATMAIRTALSAGPTESVPAAVSMDSDGSAYADAVFPDELIRRQSQWLVEAVVQVESAGDPHRVGSAGERGLMQIKEDTWDQITAELFGKALPFDRAFEPQLNRRVGTAYLASLLRFLEAHRDTWRDDDRALLLACYNAGPGRVADAGFALDGVPAQTRDYVRRVAALHDYYLDQVDHGSEFATSVADDVASAGTGIGS